MVFVNHIVDCQSPFVIFFLLLCNFYRKLKSSYSQKIRGDKYFVDFSVFPQMINAIL